MTTRGELRDQGAKVRHELGLADYGQVELAPGLPGLVDEVVFGRIWARPGLSLEDRMIAALSGRSTMRELHDQRSEDDYASPDSAAAELYATAVQFLYGEIWNRTGITRRQRMICSVAAFTATRMEAQQATIAGLRQ